MVNKIFLVCILALLMATINTSALTTGESVILKPNSSASGYYVVNNSFISDKIEVNETHVTFYNLTDDYDLVTDLTNNVILCDDLDICIIEETTSVIDIKFNESSGSVEYEFADPNTEYILFNQPDYCYKGENRYYRYPENRTDGFDVNLTNNGTFISDFQFRLNTSLPSGYTVYVDNGTQNFTVTTSWQTAFIDVALGALKQVAYWLNCTMPTEPCYNCGEIEWRAT